MGRGAAAGEWLQKGPLSRRWSRANPERASAAAPRARVPSACHWDTQEPGNRGGAGPGVPGAGGSRQGPQHFQARPLPSKDPTRGVRRLLQGHSQSPLGARLGADSRGGQSGRRPRSSALWGGSNHLRFIPSLVTTNVTVLSIGDCNHTKSGQRGPTPRLTAMRFPSSLWPGDKLPLLTSCSCTQSIFRQNDCCFSFQSSSRRIFLLNQLDFLERAEYFGI